MIFHLGMPLVYTVFEFLFDFVRWCSRVGVVVSSFGERVGFFLAEATFCKFLEGSIDGASFFFHLGCKGICSAFPGVLQFLEYLKV